MFIFCISGLIFSLIFIIFRHYYKKGNTFLIPSWRSHYELLRFLKKIKNKLNLFIQQTQSKDISKIFDKIYVDKLWGKDELEDRLFSGEGSYDPKLTDNYVKVIEDFLLSLNNPSVLDLGCGDFEVGKRLIPYIFKYIAADVSSLVIEQNKKRFSETDVKFIHLDASSNELPSVDLIIVRQVLQHLSMMILKRHWIK